MPSFDEIKEDIAMRRQEGMSYTDISYLYKLKLSVATIRRIDVGETKGANKSFQEKCDKIDLNYNLEKVKSVMKQSKAVWPDLDKWRA